MDEVPLGTRLGARRAAAALMIVLFPVLGMGGAGPDEAAPVPMGPDGVAVSDGYYFVHRPCPATAGSPSRSPR
ncbi:hypothetical protein [Dactylosporangium darangshiense]|uniref:hypothetical protein n=1 Tax=Dactylosporangium darangshiense TaxID=579108 RepID=UPI00362CF500